MTPLPARSNTPRPSGKPDADWTIRLAIGGAAGFTLLLVAFGLMLYNAWPQMSGVRQTVGILSAKTDRIASSQDRLAQDIATLRTDLRPRPLEGPPAPAPAPDTAAIQARIGELAGAIATLREQTDKLSATPPAPAPTPAQDPAINELRNRLDALQRRLDQLVAAPAAPTLPASPAPVRPAPSTPPTVVVAPKAQVDDAEREVREMQEVIRQQRESAPVPPVRAATVWTPTRPTGPSIADPLAPMTSRTQPRIAPERPGMSPTALVSWAPSAPSAQQQTDERAAAPQPRVTRVGINSGMKALGPIALPFDAIGNLVVAIGEGIDRLFTGRTYLPRPSPSDGPATARR